ncbi:MAG TPA: tRNA dihydrouridine synthase DusB, partial [Lachnospiraceae bacterium]|nr:tRNA dihydrouridine synthase DusB [Lachnospiraceae bacterium]
NPWLFEQIKSYLVNGVYQPKPDFTEVKNTILRHAILEIAYKGEYTGIREMRKHVAWYTVGYPLTAKLRSRVNTIESLQDLTQLLEEY